MSHKTGSEKPIGRAGRGFFIALICCIVAVGGVAASTFSEKFSQPHIVVSPAESTTVTATVTTASATSHAPAAVTTPARTTVTTVTTTAVVQTDTEHSPLFILPVSNQVLTAYSETPLYSETMGDYRVHKAVDFKAEAMQTVRACAAGTIKAVEIDPLWGASLTIDHGDGTKTVYRGVDATVREGAVVKVGDNVGNLADIPCERAMAPHLHVEFYRDGKAVDITSVVSGQLSDAR